MLSTWFPLPASYWGETGKLEAYGKKYPIPDCRGTPTQKPVIPWPKGGKAGDPGSGYWEACSTSSTGKASARRARTELSRSPRLTLERGIARVRYNSWHGWSGEDKG